MKHKYIIELEDTPFTKQDGSRLYRVKGFNSLVFDDVGLSKLTPYDKRAIVHEAYERGKVIGYEEGFKEARLRTSLSAAQGKISNPYEDLRAIMAASFEKLFKSLEDDLK